MITEFTPWLSLIGGVMIGLAAVSLMFTTGRVVGVSGITSRILPPKPDFGRGMGVSFLVGIIFAAPVYHMISSTKPTQVVEGDYLFMAIAGLLVGFGAIWGSGCTSGHGVCGISRFSPRSIVSTVTFMITAIATVFVLRHVIGG